MGVVLAYVCGLVDVKCWCDGVGGRAGRSAAGEVVGGCGPGSQPGASWWMSWLGNPVRYSQLIYVYITTGKRGLEEPAGEEGGWGSGGEGGCGEEPVGDREGRSQLGRRGVGDWEGKGVVGRSQLGIGRGGASWVGGGLGIGRGRGRGLWGGAS